MTYHRPVLLSESIQGLKIKPEGIYVDGTFGGGGHSKSILSQLNDKGHLFAFDQDDDARENIPDAENFTFVQANFKYLKEYMSYYGVSQVHGILADLGVSSWQFDNPERGFSYRFDHQLDMRMNQAQDLKASDILNQYSAAELQQLFSDYGQLRNARTLAQAIVAERKRSRIETIGQFLELLNPLVRGQRMRYLAQVFQSLRIVVNDEMGALKQLLEAATPILAPGGRLVIISYHSVEDQLVKRWFRAGNFSGQVVKDDFGNALNDLKSITRKPIIPSNEEIEINSRARSAKLRVAEKK